MSQEKRKFKRFSPNNSVANCRLLNTREGSGLSRFTVLPISDICLGGALVISDEMIPFHTLAYLNIDLDVVRRTVGVVGKVVWSQAREGKYALGVEFCSWSHKADKDAMADYIMQEISHNSSS